MFRWLRQKFCKHAYRKHWSRDAGGYVMRCVKCEKEVARDGCDPGICKTDV